MKINIQATIEVVEEQLDKYILELEKRDIQVNQYFIGKNRHVVISLDIYKDQLIIIFKTLNIIDIYTALTNHVNEIIVKEI